MKVVGVKVNETGKVLYYDSNNLNLKINLTVIVLDERGLQFAKVVDFMDVPDNSDYEKIVRIATKKDYLQHLKNINEAKLALDKCRELAEKNNLSQSNVKMTLSRFRTKLKEFLEERGQYI